MRTFVSIALKRAISKSWAGNPMFPRSGSLLVMMALRSPSIPVTISLPGASYDPTYGVIMPNAGYLHVTVSPADVTVSHIRAVLPGDEAKAGAANGAVAYSHSLPAR